MTDGTENPEKKSPDDAMDAEPHASDEQAPESNDAAEPDEVTEAAAVDAQELSVEEALAQSQEEPDLAAEAADAKDKMLRALAEAENVRRRAARDVENANKRAISGFARDMIVVADNLGRALDAVDPATVADNEGLKGLLTGIEMTARDMQNAFERNGIAKVDPTGQKFDPQLHEAMFEFEDPSQPAGTIGQVMEVGYTLNGQTIRPAKVGVTKGGPKETPAPKPSEQTLNEADAGGQGGSAYEDPGQPSGTKLDQEL